MYFYELSQTEQLAFYRWIKEKSKAPEVTDDEFDDDMQLEALIQDKQVELIAEWKKSVDKQSN